MLSLFNLPCRITPPRQGQGTAYRTNTALQEFSSELYATKGISDTKKNVERNKRWFHTNAPTLPEALAI